MRGLAIGCVPRSSVQGASVGNQKLALCVVVHVVARSSREHERALKVPARIGPELESATGKEGLCGCVLRALYSPRPQVFSEHRDGQPVAELALETYIARSAEILLHQGVEKKIANRVSG